MAEQLGLKVENDGQVGILVVDGYINSEGGEKIAETCKELIAGGTHRFVLNLESCRIVTSVGISILIEIIEQLKELEGRLAFCCVTPTFAKTFRIMGLLQTCTVHDTQEQAQSAVRA